MVKINNTTTILQNKLKKKLSNCRETLTEFSRLKQTEICAFRVARCSPIRLI